ncbi:MAG: hypothetical protein ACJ8R9_21905 [Steroidobacteraceae bacterium]
MNDTTEAPPEKACDDSFDLVDLGDAIGKTEGPLSGVFFDGGGRWNH